MEKTFCTLNLYIFMFKIFLLLGKLKRRHKEGRGLYLSGAKDGSALINGVDMFASANSKRGGETGQGTPCHLTCNKLPWFYSVRSASSNQHAEDGCYYRWCTNRFVEFADSSARNLVFSSGGCSRIPITRNFFTSVFIIHRIVRPIGIKRKATSMSQLRENSLIRLG